MVLKISVPATSANIGSGFDSVGLAVSLYLEVTLLEASKEWWIEHDIAGLSHTEDNLLLKTALDLVADLPPHRLQMTTAIPLARGLGSSSSVIVAGIELANQLGKLQLTTDDKLAIATQIEGHPDNVAPALLGNLVIASYDGEQLTKVTAPFPDVSLLAVIPQYELLTSDSRTVLPKTLSHKEAVQASAVANVTLAALLQGDLKTAGACLERDRFHEPYRQKLVPEFLPIRQVAKEHGAYATYLSGAGPSIMILADKTQEESIYQAVSDLAYDVQIQRLSLDRCGVRVED